MDERGDGPGVTLEVACEAPETAEPGKGAFDDLDCPVTGLGRSLRGLRPLITAITVDALNEWEQTTRAAVSALLLAVIARIAYIAAEVALVAARAYDRAI